jgi:SAM-dependent methyltransferase
MCPVCGSANSFEFLRRFGMPVHQHLLLGSPEAARNACRGELAMRLCNICGFAWNTAFQPELLAYGQNYDNTQTWSSAFDQYTDALADELIGFHGLRNCRIAEVGCGKGGFLRKLVADPEAGNRGHGYDPSYAGPAKELGERLRFSRSYYDGEPADAIVCRHVIEHVAEPPALIRSIRAGLPAGGLCFFETPCLEWILRHRVAWDFFYEHCSLFCPGALTTALMESGFAQIEVRHVFGGQYLWVKARASKPSAARNDPGPVVALAREFCGYESRLQQTWKKMLQQQAVAGSVVLWGAGAKGVTYCNLADPDAQWVRAVVDVNPAKQGRFLAGTGHPIVGPEHVEVKRAAAVLVLNPNYYAEISARLTRLGSRAILIDPMREGAYPQCA